MNDAPWAKGLAILQDIRAKNREKHKRYRETHREEIAARLKANRYTAQKKWNETHKEYNKLRYKAYSSRPDVKQRVNARNLLYRSVPKNRMRVLVNGAMVRAHRLGLYFDPSLRSILTNNPKLKCACCGVAFDFSTGNGRLSNAPSLDRLRNDMGYSRENTFVICVTCNRMKSDHSIESLERVIAYMRGFLCQ